MFAPPRLLSVRINTIEESAYWSETDGGFYDSNAYRWRISVTVAPQAHGSHRTREPYAYNGLDIMVGDWISDVPQGLAVEIIEIESVDDFGTEMILIVEDVDRFNTLTGGGGSGIGLADSDAIVYMLGDSGLPILGPAPGQLVGQNVAWSIDQMSRFSYRNLVQSYYRVEQEGHGLTVGDVVRIMEDGTYEKVVHGAPVVGVVGVVNSVGVPGVNWFTYRPSGRVVKGIVPPLPGSPGNLIYLESDGSYTATKPNRYAKPIFIRLGSADLGLQLDRNVDGTPEATGFTTQNYIVNTLDERDMLVGVNDGDTCKVRDMGNGEWASFVYDVGSWLLTMTEDASDTDAETKFIEMTRNSAPRALVATLSSGRRVTSVVVRVIEAFAGEATFNVGTTADNSILMNIDQVDLTATGSYAVQPTCVFEGGDTDIFAYLNMAGTTAGRLRVTISDS